MKTKILVILGPTATGKSDFAVHMARLHNGEVISADSRQVYKGLDLGTGKITKKEMCGIPHHLLDVARPQTSYSAVRFVEDASKAIADIRERDKLPIVCGGTGFYIQALVDGIILPDVAPDLLLRKKLSTKSPEQLMTMLHKLDPKRAETIDKHNIRRIIRAIEIARALGKVPKPAKRNDKFSPLFIGLTLGREQLQERIHTRLEKRLKKGMIVEAQNLHSEGVTWKRMHELGLEYRYLALYLQKKITLEEMKKQLTTEIWHYAKRQMTWFRRDKRIQWFDPTDTRKIEKVVKKFVGK